MGHLNVIGKTEPGWMSESVCLDLVLWVIWPWSGEYRDNHLSWIVFKDEILAGTAGIITLIYSWIIVVDWTQALKDLISLMHFNADLNLDYT